MEIRESDWKGADTEKLLIMTSGVRNIWNAKSGTGLLLPDSNLLTMLKVSLLTIISHISKVPRRFSMLNLSEKFYLKQNDNFIRISRSDASLAKLP